jgi:hypothetical protein
MDESQSNLDEQQDPRSQPHDEVAAGGRLLLGWILIVAAVVLLIAGWVGVSANPTVAAQLAYFVSGGLGGLLAGIIGVGLLVSDDVRRDRIRLGRLEAAVLETRELLAAQAETLQKVAARLDPDAEDASKGPGNGDGGAKSRAKSLRRRG